jgi:hypothetical protein
MNDMEDPALAFNHYFLTSIPSLFDFFRPHTNISGLPHQVLEGSNWGRLLIVHDIAAQGLNLDQVDESGLAEKDFLGGSVPKCLYLDDC